MARKRKLWATKPIYGGATMCRHESRASSDKWTACGREVRGPLVQCLRRRP